MVGQSASHKTGKMYVDRRATLGADLQHVAKVAATAGLMALKQCLCV